MSIALPSQTTQPALSPTYSPQRNRAAKKEGAGRREVIVVGYVTLPIWKKSLLACEEDSGAICAVRLSKHGVDAEQFTPGQRLACTAVAGDVFDYDGVAPRTFTN